MKIVEIVSLEESVPPQRYGGIELVVSTLTEQLVRLGHEVYLLASGDSKTSGILKPVIPQAIRRMYKQDKITSWRNYWKMAGVAKILTLINEIKPDIIHNHFAWRLILFEKLIQFPIMSTLHGPLSSLAERQTYQNHPDHPYISISDNQRLVLPSLNWLGTVYNGLDLSRYPSAVGEVKRDYFAFLGRTSPEKGLAEIVQMIKKTPHKLKIAAKVDTVDREYFDTKVKPYIDGKQIEFLGEIGHEAKVELLRGAKALLLWLNWEEPFGLVVIEANACGAPVVVNRRGSMSELVDDGKTGWLVDSIGEMQRQLDYVETLSPLDCRQWVDKRFSAETMSEGYLEAAEKVIRSYAYA